MQEGVKGLSRRVPGPLGKHGASFVLRTFGTCSRGLHRYFWPPRSFALRTACEVRGRAGFCLGVSCPEVEPAAEVRVSLHILNSSFCVNGRQARACSSATAPSCSLLKHCASHARRGGLDQAAKGPPLLADF